VVGVLAHNAGIKPTARWTNMSRDRSDRCSGVVSSSFVIASLDDLGTTRGECLGRTQWSSPLDWTTYLYYFYKWLYTTSPRSHVLLECSTITWPRHVIWLLKFPRYLYLVHCMTWCLRSSVWMRGKLSPSWGSHNTKSIFIFFSIFFSFLFFIHGCTRQKWLIGKHRTI